MSLKSTQKTQDNKQIELTNLLSSIDDVTNIAASFDNAIALAKKQGGEADDNHEVAKLEQQKSAKILELLTNNTQLVLRVVITSIQNIESKSIGIANSQRIKSDIDTSLTQLIAQIDAFKPTDKTIISERNQLKDRVSANKMEIAARFALHFSFLSSRASFESVNYSRTNGKNIEIIDLNDDTFPLLGKDISLIIHRGITSTNPELSTENTMPIADVMRALDKIYAGKIEVVVHERLVKPSNLFRFVDEAINAIINSTNNQPQLKLDRDTFLVAYRLHGLITQHESILPNKTPTEKDDYQKLYRPDLYRKYMSPEQSVAAHLMIGEQDSNWMETIFTQADIDWIKNKIGGINGVPIFLRFLFQNKNGEFATNTTVDLIKSIEHLSEEVSHPLLDFDCVKTPLDYMEHYELTDEKTFSEYKDENGEFLYEDMPFEKTSSLLEEYYRQLPNLKRVMDVLDCSDLSNLDKVTTSTDSLKQFENFLHYNSRLLKLPPNMSREKFFSKVFFRLLVIQTLRYKPFGGQVTEDLKSQISA